MESIHFVDSGGVQSPINQGKGTETLKKRAKSKGFGKALKFKEKPEFDRTQIMNQSDVYEKHRNLKKSSNMTEH